MTSSDKELSLAIFVGADKAMNRWKDQTDMVRGIAAMEFINGVHFASQILVVHDGGITAQDLTRGVALSTKTLGLVLRGDQSAEK